VVSWLNLSRHERAREAIESELRQSEGRYRHLFNSANEAALHDGLTCLPNRAMLRERLANAIECAGRTGQPYALLFLDLDRFKVINDSLGHGAGDQLLVSLADRIERTLARSRAAGDQSIVGRLGGDEFVVLLSGNSAIEGAARIAERIHESTAEPFVIEGQNVHTTVSIGIVLGDHRYSQPEEVLRDADAALYSAKNAGRARSAVFNEEMHSKALDRLRLDNELRQAIERAEFTVFYHPIVLLESGQVTGFEALVRWRHPQRGLMSPPAFIAVAEETGLIVPIGWQVLEAACRQLRLLGDQFPDGELSISVNLSRRQLLEKNLAERLSDLVRRGGIKPHLLKLEVMESVLMEHANEVIPLLAELRKCGFKLAMDDFGTGHSSLSCLHRFPVDYLKIDRSFISNMGLNRPYAAIVHAVVTLAHNLGIEVIAEGVETADQVAELQTLDCDFAQGYLFSKPVPANDLPALIANTSWLRQSA
jgi:diguanylate cyclase (GGDEF)-like protein